MFGQTFQVAFDGFASAGDCIIECVASREATKQVGYRHAIGVLVVTQSNGNEKEHIVAPVSPLAASPEASLLSYALDQALYQNFLGVRQESCLAMFEYVLIWHLDDARLPA
jgi:hypothetical protein